jgi:hypothetical protein
MTTLFAAFIGALVGSIGSVLVEELIRRRREEREQRKALVRRFLFPLQDAVESLWHRLYNIGYEEGRSVMPDEYFRTTTVYAFGRVLAAERTLGEEGVYPILREFFPELAGTLERRLVVALELPALQQYDRIALGEAVLERDEYGTRPGTYLAFRNRYVERAPEGGEWLVRAAAAVTALPQETVDEFLDLLGPVAHLASGATGLPPSILEKELELEQARGAAAGTVRGGY